MFPVRFERVDAGLHVGRNSMVLFYCAHLHDSDEAKEDVVRLARFFCQRNLIILGDCEDHHQEDEEFIRRRLPRNIDLIWMPDTNLGSQLREKEIQKICPEWNDSERFDRNDYYTTQKAGLEAFLKERKLLLEAARVVCQIRSDRDRKDK